MSILSTVDNQVTVPGRHHMPSPAGHLRNQWRRGCCMLLCAAASLLDFLVAKQSPTCVMYDGCRKSPVIPDKFCCC
jgi:hypothetical protein